MNLITKNDGDVQKVRQADDMAAAVERTEAEVDYIAMMDGVKFGEEEDDEQ